MQQNEKRVQWGNLLWSMYDWRFFTWCCSWLTNQRQYKRALAVENLSPTAIQSIHLNIKALHVWGTERANLKKSWKDFSIRRHWRLSLSAWEHSEDVEIPLEWKQRWANHIFPLWRLWCWQHFYQAQLSRLQLSEHVSYISCVFMSAKLSLWVLVFTLSHMIIIPSKEVAELKRDDININGLYCILWLSKAVRLLRDESTKIFLILRFKDLQEAFSPK